MPFETIVYEKKGVTGVIAFNRPRQKNALSIQMAHEIWQAIERAEKDDQVRVVVFKGSEECFCSGADLKEIARLREKSEQELRSWYLETGALFGKIEDMEKPTIAVISGWCLAGGLELAVCCDLRVASETAQIGDRHAKVGAVGGEGATSRLPRLIGIAKAKELIFTGDSINGVEAHRIGLVNQVYPPSGYAEGAMELAGRIGKIGMSTLKLSKKAINWGYDMDIHESLHLNRIVARIARNTPERQEGQKAFLEKREAKF
jgi:enoyl-CoA hydratase